MRPPDPHGRPGPSAAIDGGLDGSNPIEPNAWGAPLCPVTGAILFVGKRFRRLGEFRIMGSSVPPPFVGG
jgi:hypothetical protein